MTSTSVKTVETNQKYFYPVDQHSKNVVNRFSTTVFSSTKEIEHQVVERMNKVFLRKFGEKPYRLRVGKTIVTIHCE